MTTSNLHQQILSEFLNSNIKIISLDKLNQYIAYCINNNQNEKIKSKTSYHHILPRAKDCFPEFKDLKANEWNGTHLLHKDHYYAHWLLTEAIDSYSQLFAFCAMHNKDMKLGRIDESDLIPAEEFQEKMRQRGKNFTEWDKINGYGRKEKQKKTKNSKEWKETVGIEASKKISATLKKRISENKNFFESITGENNYATNNVYIYNANDELMFISKGSLTKFIKDNKLPISLRKTLKNNKRAFASNKTGGVSKEIVEKYKGWFMS